MDVMLKQRVVQMSRRNRLPRFVSGAARRVYRWGPLAWQDLGLMRDDRKWREELSRERSLEEWFGFVREAFDGTIRPQQRPVEIVGLLELLRSRRVRRILEIGTAEGGTLFLLCRVLDPDGLIVSVDLPGGWFGGGYPPWRKRLYRRFAAPGQKMELLRADSHDRRTLEAVKRCAGGELFDFIFIDGDHTYEGAKQDFEMYRGLLAEGGVVGFHDIVPKPRDPQCEVHRLWEELKARYEVVEFVEDWSQDYAGIGVVMDKGGDVSGRTC